MQKNEETRIAISAQVRKKQRNLQSRVKIKLAVLKENKSGIEGKEEEEKPI